MGGETEGPSLNTANVDDDDDGGDGGDGRRRSLEVLATGLVNIYLRVAPIFPAYMDAINLKTPILPDLTPKFRGLVRRTEITLKLDFSPSSNLCARSAPRWGELRDETTLRQNETQSDRPTSAVSQSYLPLGKRAPGRGA